MAFRSHDLSGKIIAMSKFLGWRGLIGLLVAFLASP
jgi:hypothetical protein